MSVDALRGGVSWLIGFMGENKTVTIHQQSGFTVDGNTGAVSGTPATTATTLPAMILALEESDIDGTLVQETDRMVVVDITNAPSLDISDDDQITIDTDPVAIRRVLPIKPGDTEVTVRLAVEGVS
jgi:hypothetical protein